MNRASSVVCLALLLLAQAAAADPLPGIQLSCSLPRTSELSEFCGGGTTPSSMNLLCNAQGQWDGGQSFSAHCEAAVNPQFTFDAASHTTNGPYLVLSLQIDRPATQLPFENTDTRQAVARATYSIRVSSPTLSNNTLVPIRLPLVGALQASASHGSAKIVASAFGADLAAQFTACAPACPAGTATASFREVIRFRTGINRQNAIAVTLKADIDGPLGSEDPNGAGRVAGFIDPLPELDAEADPAQYGLPADWMDQVTLEISDGARVDDALATTVDAGGGCSVAAPRRNGRADAAGLGVGLLLLALARSARSRMTEDADRGSHP